MTNRGTMEDLEKDDTEYLSFELDVMEELEPMQIKAWTSQDYTARDYWMRTQFIAGVDVKTMANKILMLVN